MINTTFFPDRVGGAELHTLWIARELKALGQDVTIICGGWPEYCQQTYAPVTESKVEGIRTIRLALSRAWDGNPWGIHSSVYNWGKDFFSAERPDILHFGLFWELVGLASAAFEIAIPYTITTHLHSVYCHNGRLMMPGNLICDGRADLAKCRLCLLKKWAFRHRAGARLATYIPGPFLKRWEAQFPLAKALSSLYGVFSTGRLFLKNAAMILAPTEFMRDEIIKNGVRPEKVTVCQHGVPDEFFRRKVERKKGDSLHFVSISRLSYEKGILTLIRAFSSLRELAHTQLFIYGSGPEDFARKVKTASRRDGRIRIAGPLPHEKVAKKLAEADALIAPSECKEASGLNVREALAMGIPVIASRIGGLTEAIKPRKNGLLFIPKDVISLQNSLRDFCSLNSLRKPLPEDVRFSITISQNAKDKLRILNTLLQDWGSESVHKRTHKRKT